MRVPVIGKTDCVVIGGSMDALDKAVNLSGCGKQVTMVVSDTFLGTDICSTNQYDIPDEVKGGLPDFVFQESGTLHPDRWKGHLEKLCDEKGIRIFYFMWVVDWVEMDGNTLIRTASKGGMCGICCKEIYDMRKRIKDISYQAYVKYPGKEWNFLKVENIGTIENGTMENLYCCKKALLEKFASVNKGSHDLQLGRFALRGYGGVGQGGNEKSAKKKSIYLQKVIS